MKRKIIIPVFILSLALLFAACGKTDDPSSSDTNDIPSSSDSVDSGDSDSGGEEETPKVTPEDIVKDLMKDEYDGLEMTASIDEAGEIAPGSVIPVSVSIKNTGDKTIAYTHGSGSSTTPDALMMSASGLQPIIAKDKLGIHTMDLRVDELEPGEELTFTLYILAVEAAEDFDDITYKLFDEDGTYIGEIDWRENTDTANLVEAAAGEYQANVYFTYFIVDEEASSGSNLAGEATGYAEAVLPITVASPAAE